MHGCSRTQFGLKLRLSRLQSCRAWDPRIRSCLRSLPINEDHPFVVHGELVTFEGPAGCTGSFPLHCEFWALASIGGFDLTARLFAWDDRKDHSAAASALGVDSESAGLDIQ